jgi:diacylglycerol kinase family enzyme
VLLNAAAGVKAQLTPERICELFAEQGSAVEVVAIDRGDDLCAAAKAALEKGHRTLVAAGGDGTVNAVASCVAGTDAVLGVLPLGTLNHFAKDLAVPLKIEDAVATIVGGRTKRVDVGEVNGRTFVNNSSIGLYPAMVQNREVQQRLGRGKWAAFVRAMWTVLGRYPLLHVGINADGQVFTRRTPLVFIGNNDYHIAGLNVGARDRLDAGKLSLYVTRDVGRWNLALFAVRALFGRLRDTVDFDNVQTAAATIVVRSSSLRVATDGEVCRMEPPLEFRIRAGDLQVLVPPEPPPQP